MSPLRRSLLLVALTLLLLPSPAQAAGVVQPLWDITTPLGRPVPERHLHVGATRRS